MRRAPDFSSGHLGRRTGPVVGDVHLDRQRRVARCRAVVRDGVAGIAEANGRCIGFIGDPQSDALRHVGARGVLEGAVGGADNGTDRIELVPDAVHAGRAVLQGELERFGPDAGGVGEVAFSRRIQEDIGPDRGAAQGLECHGADDVVAAADGG